MGSRRLGRKRLHSLEKLGQKVDLESGISSVAVTAGSASSFCRLRVEQRFLLRSSTVGTAPLNRLLQFFPKPPALGSRLAKDS